MEQLEAVTAVVATPTHRPRRAARAVVTTGMRAARLHSFGEALRIEALPRPQPRGDEVLVRVAAAGLGRCDLRVMDGDAGAVPLPLTPGHEVSGHVAALGPEATGLRLGEAVLVQPAWGCGRCAACLHGDEHLCLRGHECGSTAPGGFADLLLVPHARHVVRIDGLDPIQAAPLAGAALTPYHALQRVRGKLVPGSAVVVIGAGALGQYAIQLADVLTPALIVVVDINPRKEAPAREAGADHVVDLLDANAVAATLGGRPAVVVLDFVGGPGTLDLAVRLVAPQGEVLVAGRQGGTLHTPLLSLPAEASIATVRGGSRRELDEVVALARTGQIHMRAQRFQLDRVNDAVTALRAGWVSNRAVVVPAMT
jgi:alcohol dehydrogenase, propanol-preferring